MMMNQMMMNHMMGSGAGSTLIGGIRIADWALGLTYGVMLLIGLLLIAYSVRSLFLSLMESRQRRREELSSVPTRQKMPEDLQMYLASEKTRAQSRLQQVILGTVSSTPEARTQSSKSVYGISNADDEMARSLPTSSESRHTRQYGESIHGRSADGTILRAAVFNENEVRAAAGLTLALGATAFMYAYFVHIYLPIQFVTITFFLEFLIRVTAGLQYSPMGVLARWMTQRQPPDWASAKPKRFAWTLGLIMSLAMVIITNSGVRGALPFTICLICLTLMWMESALGFCLGCEIHGLMVRRGWARKDEAFEVCAHGACTSEPQHFPRKEHDLEPPSTLPATFRHA